MDSSSTDSNLQKSYYNSPIYGLLGLSCLLFILLGILAVFYFTSTKCEDCPPCPPSFD